MIRVILVGIVALAAASRPAHACTITSSTGVSFGVYNVYAAAPLDSAGTITYSCTLSISVTIDIGTGSGTYASRTMRAGTSTLAYNLYTNAARTTVWGDGTSGTGHHGPVLGLIGSTTVSIYGRVPAGQDVAAGSYTDTVVVTLNY